MTGFTDFQSGCGICKASTDYADMYYAQSAPPSQAGGARRRKTSTKKSSTKKSSTSKKSSTKRLSSRKVVKKSSTRKTVKRTVKRVRKMRGGGESAKESASSSKQLQLDEKFLRENLGISFQTIAGGAKKSNRAPPSTCMSGGGNPLMAPKFYQGGFLDAMRNREVPGYDATASSQATVGGAKRRSSSSRKLSTKKSVKKSTTKKSTTKKSTSSKKKTSSKKRLVKKVVKH